MKAFLIATLMLGSLSALAHEKYVCQEYNFTSGALKNSTVVLTQTGPGELTEGKKMKFSFELFKKNSLLSELEAEGTVETEDVSFLFTSNDKKISFHIYLDEMNQSSLTVNKIDKGMFLCR